MATNEEKTVKYPNQNILKALFDFQGEAFVIKRTAENKYAGYKYAPLETILETIRPFLQKHKIMYYQFFEEEISEGNKANYLTTQIIHIPTGEMLNTRLEFAVLEAGKMNSVQAMGATITYLRKYELLTILGLVSEEDTDGRVEGSKPNAFKRPEGEAPNLSVNWEKKQNSVDNQIAIFNATKKKIASVKSLEELTVAMNSWEEYKKGPEMKLNPVQVKTVEELLKLKEQAFQEALLEDEDLDDSELEAIDNSISNFK